MKLKHTIAAVLAISAAVAFADFALLKRPIGEVGTTGFTLGYAEHLNSHVVRADASFFQLLA